MQLFTFACFMNLLVIVAHPDDESIICGATIDKLIQNGHQVTVSFATNNNQAYFGTETQSLRVKRTRVEAIKSSRVLGFKPRFLNFVDMELVENQGKLMQACITEIRSVKPDIIITHHEHDKHIDHQTLGRIVPEANFQSGCKLCGGTVKASAPLVLKGEIDLEMTNAFEFHVVSTISSTNLKQKLKSFSCYESVKDEHNTDSQWLEKKLKTCLSLRGRSVNADFGEAFRLDNYAPISIMGIANLFTLLKS